MQVMYTPEPEDSYVEAAILTVLQLHEKEPAGHILVFLTGQEEIEAVRRLLPSRCAFVAACCCLAALYIPGIWRLGE